MMGKNRDDFSQKDKEIIAKRAGYLCSFPGCGSLTLSASDESETSVSSSGMACHISAAAGGRNARRFDKNLSSEERKHPNNGIWMCYKHGKIIDTDETRFTTEILLYWKNLSAQISKIMHDHSLGYSEAVQNIPNAMGPTNIIFNVLKSENELIGDAITDSCVPLVWGHSLSFSIRDLLIEISRNSLTHGGATEVSIKIDNNKIILIDDGESFNFLSLKTIINGNGGQLSLNHILEKYGEEIILTNKREEDKNFYIIAKMKQPTDIFEITPCSISLTLSQIKLGVSDYTINEECNELFIVLPKYLSLSDSSRAPANDKLLQERRPITFIGENLSEMVLKNLSDKFPTAKIIQTKSYFQNYANRNSN